MNILQEEVLCVECPQVCFQISGSVYSRSVSVLWLAVQGRGPAHSLTVDYLEVLHLRSLHRDKLELNLRNKQFRQNPVILIPHQSPGPTDRQSTSHQLSLSLTPQSTTVLFHSLVFIIIVSLSFSLSLFHKIRHWFRTFWLISLTEPSPPIRLLYSANIIGSITSFIIFLGLLEEAVEELMEV